MFICKLCDGGLLSTQKILGTYCGHLFHKECLDHHLVNRSSNCPSCENSLRVDLTCFSSGYAVLSLYPEERKQDEQLSAKNGHSTRQMYFFIHGAMKENVILKQKLAEAIQGLLIMQKELKNQAGSTPSPYSDSPHLQPIVCDNKKPKYQTKIDVSWQGHHNKTNKSITGMIISDILQTTDVDSKPGYDADTDEPSQIVTTNYSHRDAATLMCPELLILRDKAGLGNGLSEEERNRFVRSKRREYLTWRNKAQSWLSKMNISSNRLLQSEESFTAKQYLQQLRLFYDKAYNQGGIIQEVRQAAAVYLIVDDEIPEVEIEEIHQKVSHLTESHSFMLNAVLNQINCIEAGPDDFEDALLVARASTFGTNSSIGSEDDDRQTVIESGVSAYPKKAQRPKGKVVMLISEFSGLNDIDIYRTPVFV